MYSVHTNYFVFSIGNAVYAVHGTRYSTCTTKYTVLNIAYTVHTFDFTLSTVTTGTTRTIFKQTVPDWRIPELNRQEQVAQTIMLQEKAAITAVNDGGVP